MSSLKPSLIGRASQAAIVNGHISLTDNTVPSESEQSSAEDGGDAVTKTVTKGGTSQRLGPGRLREQIARRKYAKYQEERYQDSDEDGGSVPATRTTTVATANAEQVDSTGGVEAARPVLDARTGTFRRGRERVKGLLGRKKTKPVKDGDAEIDILFENQRGTFLFGMPFYSSNSLLNFDPPGWTTAEGKPSPVDITNAQVPDPNWEWAWRTWYVDMSLDVDEQGWQYSFMFQAKFSWHGTHPWFHSFVRRRRWIRKRVRKHRHLPDGRVEGGRTMHDAHKLNEDYFTIHPSSRGKSPDSSYPPTTNSPSSIRQFDGLEGTSVDDEEIENIKALMNRLKNATVDREKIRAVLQFMDKGGQDTYYLADEIPHIMSLFIFEHSRRQLVTSMLRKVDGKVSEQDRKDSEQDSVVPEGDEGTKPEDQKATAGKSKEDETKRQNLLRAIKAADQEVKNFEYWSDIRRMVEKGETLTGSDLAHGWDETWQGLGSSGPAGSLGNSDPAEQNKRVDKGKGKA